MYQFLYLFGSGAISFVVICFLEKIEEISFIKGFTQVMALSLINNAVTMFALMPFSKVVLKLNEDGTSFVQYGPVAVIFSIIVAILISLVVIVIKNYVKVEINVEEKNE